jgi:hypothetical protein
VTLLLRGDVSRETREGVWIDGDRYADLIGMSFVGEPRYGVLARGSNWLRFVHIAIDTTTIDCAKRRQVNRASSPRLLDELSHIHASTVG